MRDMSTKDSHWPRTREGFSLVETVLAMAVMAMAVTVLLGLLPHGLEMSRKAGIATGEARVVSDILAELSQVQWADLDEHDQELYSYSDQGVRVSGNTPQAYRARISLPQSTTLPGFAQAQPNLRRVVIDISATPNSQYDFPAGSVFSTYTSMLSNTGL